MKRVGVIVNPIAGIGGRVGLKGSDGAATLKLAIERGAKPESPKRAIQAFKVLNKIKEKIQFITYPKEMGEFELIEAGIFPNVIGRHDGITSSSIDTVKAAQAMIDRKVDLLIFAGGDGTARDIYSVVKDNLVIIGIPSGVKIHSGVFAVNPKSAGLLALQYLQDKKPQIKQAAVMDLDEEDYRHGRVSSKLFGFMNIAHSERFVQNVKARSRTEGESLNAIAHDVIDNMIKDVYYIIAPGTTTRRIMEILNLKNTLIGVDIIKNKKIILNDVAETDLWNIVKFNDAIIVVTSIGGQGHIFGRGNQQISPRIITKVGFDGIIVVATNEKLLSLSSRALLVDTGDISLDRALCGYKRVVVGSGKRTICKVSNCN